MSQPKAANAREKDNSLSLVPRISKSKKSEFQSRIAGGHCPLSEDDCKSRHPKGCREAFLNSRGLAYQNINIHDPRFDGPRPCTVDEAYWFLMYDPASEWTSNKDGPSIHDMVEYFSNWARAKGLFSSDPPSDQSLRSAWTHHEKKHKSEIGVAKAPTLDQDLQAEKSTKVDTEKFEAAKTSPYDNPSIANNADGVESILESNKTAKESDNIRWVANMMPLKSSNIDIMSAPSSAAVGLLQWARSDPKTFYSQFYVKLLPTQKEFERENQMQDRGGSLDRLRKFIDDFAANP